MGKLHTCTVVFLTAVFLFPAGTARAHALVDDDWRALAAYWAPVIAQGTGTGFRMDVITAFPESTKPAAGQTPPPPQTRGDMPSIVYYWVVETGGYYFIGYALYHEAATETGAGSAYPHDWQGILLAVEKHTNQPMGRLALLSTWGRAHPGFYAERSPCGTGDELCALWEHNVRFETAPADGVGDIDFVIDSLGVHPVIYVASGHHGVFGEIAEAGFPQGPAAFENQSVADWRAVRTLADSSGHALRARMRNPGNAMLSGGPGGGVPSDDGLLYRYEGASQPVITSRSRGRGTMFHHWNLIAYDLEALSGLWRRRLDYERPDDESPDHESDNATVFRDYGIFASPGEAGPTSRAPWAWGKLFFDPVAYFSPALETAGDAGEHAITATSFETPERLRSEYGARADSLP